MPGPDSDDAQQATTEDASTDKPRRVTKYDKQQAEKTIEDLCKKLTEVYGGDVYGPFFNRHISPNFQFHLANVRHLNSRQEYREHLLGVRATFPNWKATALAITVELQEKITKAKVWMLLRHSNYPEGCEREACSMFIFKRSEEGVWVSQGQYGFPGVAPLPLPLEPACPADADHSSGCAALQSRRKDSESPSTPDSDSKPAP
ncbi:unnamed protein product [Cercospora beticola]|nr:unnamed protein product [Cercospora beticola]